MLDTKTLHDIARDAGIDMRNEDHSDAVNVWKDSLIQDHEYWIEYALDDIFEFALENRDHCSAMLTEVAALINSSKITELAVRLDIPSENQLATSVCEAFRLANIGTHFMTAVMKGLEKRLERLGEEMWADVQAYAGDMEEGAREDYLYEMEKDRQLERRS